MMICQLESESKPFIHANNIQYISTMLINIEITTVDILTYAIYLRKYLDVLCKASCLNRYSVLKKNSALLRKVIGKINY